MPGAMDDNLRRAFLQEELGVFLLRGIAAVAPVPRPQDLGVDAVATLLRRIQGRRLIADKSFYVQLKAGSVKRVSYSGAGLGWLKALQLPFFIGSVNPRESRLSLYTCHRAYVALTQSHEDYHTLKLAVGEPKHGTYWKKESPADAPHKGKTATVWLGAPILTWTPSEVASQEFLQQTFDLLRPILDVESRNAQFRSFKYIETFSWKTGQPPKIEGFEVGRLGLQNLDRFIGQPIGAVMAGLYNDPLQTLLPELSPLIRTLGFHCIMNSKHEDWTQTRSFIEWMRAKGFDPDPERYCEKLIEKVSSLPPTSVKTATASA